jgi:uncharacterized protein (TIGR03067 family)
MWRVPLVLLAIPLLTAFAPTPFLPRKKARGEGVSLTALQGKWRRAKIEIENGGVRREESVGKVTHVRITDDNWTFLPDDYEGARLKLAVDTSKSPARFNLYKPGAPGVLYGVGLIRRQGAAVQILYTWGGEARRPASFDRIPPGAWLCTMQRD